MLVEADAVTAYRVPDDIYRCSGSSGRRAIVYNPVIDDTRAATIRAVGVHITGANFLFSQNAGSDLKVFKNDRVAGLFITILGGVIGYCCYQIGAGHCGGQRCGIGSGRTDRCSSAHRPAKGAGLIDREKGRTAHTKHGGIWPVNCKVRSHQYIKGARAKTSICTLAGKATEEIVLIVDRDLPGISEPLHGHAVTALTGDNRAVRYLPVVGGALPLGHGVGVNITQAYFYRAVDCGYCRNDGHSHLCG